MHRAFWISFIFATGVYLSMVFWSLPFIAGQAGGLAPFDMRPTGYSVTEARAFTQALTEEGRAFYLDVQHKLDFAYPALLGTFSASVSDAEQGWIMGVTTAGFTLAAGIFSLIGGVMMAVDIRLPFYICIAAAIGALILMRYTWRHPDIEAITR